MYLDEKEAALIHREIALMKLVAPHPHLVELFDVFESESNLSVFSHLYPDYGILIILQYRRYLVTEYCPVGELFQYITQNALTKVERCRFYSQLISAVRSYPLLGSHLLSECSPKDFVHSYCIFRAFRFRTETSSSRTYCSITEITDFCQSRLQTWEWRLYN